MRSVIGLATMLLVWSAPRAAPASERAFAVVWRAPAECPDESAVERYVEQVVGEAGTGPLTVRAVGTASRSADGRYLVTLQLDTGSAEPSVRSIDGRDCEAVAQASALLIALAIRAHAAPGAAPPASARPPAPVAAPAAPAPAASRLRPFLSIAPLADWGSTPSATLGLGLSGGLIGAGLRLEPSIGYFAPRSERLAGRPEVGARFTLATLGARLCAPVSLAALWLAPCLGGGVDWLRGVGFGSISPQSGSAVSAVVRGGVLLGSDISSIFSVHFELEGVVPLARQRFEVVEPTDAALVFQRSAWATRAAFALDVHF